MHTSVHKSSVPDAYTLIIYIFLNVSVLVPVMYVCMSVMYVCMCMSVMYACMYQELLKNTTKS